MVLLKELLDVPGRGPAGAGLEQSAPVHQRDDREHLGARPQLEDREQVGQVVAQHVAGDRDRVLVCPRALERVPRRLRPRRGSRARPRRCRARRAPARTLRSTSASWARVSSSQKIAGVVVSRARATARRTQSWIGASLVWHMRQMSPASTSCSSSVSPASSTTRTVPDASISNVLSCEPYSSAAWAISPMLGVRAHPGRVERAVLLAVLDGLGVQRGVRVVGDHELGVLRLSVRIPHLARGADRRRHRCVDDHVARHVEVGDPPRGVDHGQRRLVHVGGVDRPV